MFVTDSTEAEWPSDEELAAIVEAKRAEQKRKATVARKAGFVFDPIVGYVPWGPEGPALEIESEN